MHLLHSGLPNTPVGTGKCMNLHSSNCMILHSNKVPKDKHKVSHNLTNNSLTKVSYKFLTIVVIAFHRLR